MIPILDHLPAGNILDKPRPKHHVPDPSVAANLRAKIYAACLPAQQDFLEDEKHRIVGYIGGFGSGKSFALACKLLTLAMANPGTTLMALEPTFPLLRTVLFPTLDAVLEQFDIAYNFRTSPQPEYLIHLPTGTCKVLCQSEENWSRLRGQNISCCVADELDTLPVETAQKCSEMLLARMRTGQLNQLAVASTPEGYRWAYRTFVERDGPDKRQITVDTRDNPHLPAEFVPSLERNYPSQLIAAYLSGQYVNMASCSLYPDFDRSRHYTDDLPRDLDTIYIGVDINVGNSVTEHLVRRGDCFHFIGEAVYRDTPQMAAGLRDRYPRHFRAGRLVLIPDASARQRSTAAAQESDVSILKKAGHRVETQQVNPLVQDRVNAFNVLIGQDRVKVSNACIHLVKTLEQHSYDEKGRPEKGGVGMEDLSHAGDAAGYVIFRLARLAQYTAGNGMNLVAAR